MKYDKVKTVILLHVVLLFYSLIGICYKLAANQDLLSFRFILFYGFAVVGLGIYAIIWQQIIKRMSLVSAYMNKAVTIVWGIIWGKLFFNETITIQNIIGSIVVIVGIFMVVTDKGVEQDA